MIIENNASKRKDKILIQSIIGYSFFSMLNVAIKNIIPMSDVIWKLLSYLTAIIIIFLFMRSIRIAFKRKGKLLVIIESLFVIVIMYSILKGTKLDNTFIRKTITTLGICVSGAIFIAAVVDLNEYYKYYEKMSYIFIIIISISMAFGVRNEILGSYSQTLSYSLLIPILFQIDIALDKNKLINYFIVLMGLIGLVLFGSRGPLLPIIVFLILKFTVGMTQKGKKWTIITIFVVLALIIFLNYEFILKVIERFLLSSGINSYNLKRLLANTLTSSEARTSLRRIYWQLIKERPIWGWGIYGGMIGDGLGPHNGLLEILMAFGLLAGIPLCTSLVLLVLRTFFINKGIYHKLLLIYGSSIIRLFFYSGNIFGNFELFIFVTLGLRSLMVKNKKPKMQFTDWYVVNM